MEPGSFIGVYSSATPGHRRAAHKRYWFVWDCADEGYRVQALDEVFQPRGEALAVDPTTFTASFSSEPTILSMPPDHRSGGGDTRSPGTAEQRSRAISELESSLRADFAALLLKARRGEDIPGTLHALREIACREEGIEPEHKFMFAEFGINLRKGKFPEAALEHAKRVLILAPDDGNAHFNIARVYHALGKLQEAEQHLGTALELTPQLEYARDFLLYINKERRRKHARTPREHGR